DIIFGELFRIEPKSGELKPGETTTVTCTYNHKVAEIHSIPILLNVKDGKGVCIDLKGQTLQKNQRHLHFLSLEHEFLPVEIGTRSPPVQYFCLRNPSELKITYSIDMTEVKKLNQLNYNFEILTLDNPTGEVEELSFKLLRFIFRPL